jgi:Chaperone of endosialidase
MPVLIDSVGKLGTTSGSSRRFKTQIKPMDKASESILALRPVTFCYTGDNTSTLQFGLIAEDVVEVNPELTVRDKTGELVTVRYDAVNAMLLNEFLKEHRKVQELEATVAQQRKDFEVAIARLKETVSAQLREQASQIQKVRAEVEAAKSAEQMFAENP